MSRSRLTALLVVLALVFAACGSDDGAEVRELDDGSDSGSASGSASGSGSASAPASGSTTEGATDADGCWIFDLPLPANTPLGTWTFVTAMLEPSFGLRLSAALDLLVTN